MALNIDHVTIAGLQLEPLQRAFADVGLPAVYGGPHSNGITHMAMLSFADGSYIELISTLEAGQRSPLWEPHIAGDGGPCAWAVGVQDVAAEVARMAALGVPATGPVNLNRQRPDSVWLEWDLAFLGDKQPGATLPFLIKDRTPRDWRVPESTRLADPKLTGMSMVILGVQNMDLAVDRFRRVYEWPAPTLEENSFLGARLAHFPDTPVTVAVSRERGDWLSERLHRFGDSPCAFLIGSSDFEATCAEYPLVGPVLWFERQVAWFAPGRLRGVRLGVIAA